MKIRSIKSIRSKIDSIDSAIIKLLIKRMELSERISGQKREITDSERENTVLRNIRTKANGKLDEKFLERIFSLIIEESKKVQQNSKNPS